MGFASSRPVPRPRERLGTTPRLSGEHKPTGEEGKAARILDVKRRDGPAGRVADGPFGRGPARGAGPGPGGRRCRQTRSKRPQEGSIGRLSTLTSDNALRPPFRALRQQCATSPFSRSLREERHSSNDAKERQWAQGRAVPRQGDYRRRFHPSASSGLTHTHNPLTWTPPSTARLFGYRAFVATRGVRACACS